LPSSSSRINIARDCCSSSNRVIVNAARNNVPAVYGLSAYARDGGLLSYGADLIDTYRLPPRMSIASCAATSRAISRCSFRQNLRWP
jgi:hypothetical protein